MCHRAVRKNVVLTAGLQIGMAEKIGDETCRFGCAIDEARGCNRTKQMRPHGLSKGITRAGLDLGSNGTLGHRFAPAVNPEASCFISWTPSKKDKAMYLEIVIKQWRHFGR